MAGRLAAGPDPDVEAERRLDERTDDLIRGAATRAGWTRDCPDPRDCMPMAWDMTRFAVTFKLGDLDWIADSALKYTGE